MRSSTVYLGNKRYSHPAELPFYCQRMLLFSLLQMNSNKELLLQHQCVQVYLSTRVLES